MSACSKRREIEEISIGDYVLSGGELAAMVLLDACVRLLPGVAGNEASLAEESFASGLLEYPHYTRPRDWEGRPIPDILLSGDHDKIAKWRKEQAEAITKSRRPDLWETEAPLKESGLDHQSRHFHSELRRIPHRDKPRTT